ncbi:hypothetical protein [Aliterella atlantica]|uniref:Uncharacterized protein n=1 Tax=Aliterella atlantica CENA595 TaxID=1618023 RepID=A0A0D8ZQQ9_9CYAN|nr:hypothetical protein [Aliterella atlantica]KJH70814.1 hypothetical protein UH38_15525 [Aliterella atlantica CENA595]
MNYQDIKLISSRELEAKSNQPSRQSWLSKVWQALTTYLSQDSDLRVWRSDKKGHTVWKLYNPTTGNTLNFNSETEVRTWIEESYHHSVPPQRTIRPYAWYQIER